MLNNPIIILSAWEEVTPCQDLKPLTIQWACQCQRSIEWVSFNTAHDLASFLTKQPVNQDVIVQLNPDDINKQSTRNLFERARCRWILVFEHMRIDARHLLTGCCTQLIQGRGAKSFRWAIRWLSRTVNTGYLRLIYGQHPDQFVQLYKPETPSRKMTPLLFILIHGGFWKDAIELDIMFNVANFLVAQGHFVINMEYRRGPESGQYFTACNDTNRVLHAIKTEWMDVFQNDLNIIIIGQSAGATIGQMALSYHTTHYPKNSPAVIGFISLAGILALENNSEYPQVQSNIHHWINGNDQSSTISAQQRPALQPLSQTPQLIIHGDQDDTVPMAISKTYVNNQQSMSLTNECHAITFWPIKEKDHMDLLKTDDDLWLNILDWCQDIQTRQLSAPSMKEDLCYQR